MWAKIRVGKDSYTKMFPLVLFKIIKTEEIGQTI